MRTNHRTVYRHAITVAAASVAVALSSATFAASSGTPEAPDNSGVNRAIEDTGGLNAQDQGSSERDVAITRTIRQTLHDDDALSVNAKNVKIITNKGEVTLKGPVRSLTEKRLVEQAAVRAVGVQHIHNELRIAAH